jgi:hypothetical protein
MIYYKCKKDKREKNMRKLNELQVAMIKKDFGRLANIIIINVQKYGKETETLANDIELAYDIMLQQAE